MNINVHQEPQALIKLLKKWNISKNIIVEFIENGITLNMMHKLTDKNLQELCPHIATRLILRRKIKEYSQCQDLQASMLDVNKDLINEEISRPSTSKFQDHSRFVCSWCNQHYASFEEYILHTTKAHPDKFSCLIENCFRTYHNKYGLKYHFDNSHQNILSTGKNQFQKENIFEPNSNMCDPNSNTLENNSSTSIQNESHINSQSTFFKSSHNSPELNNNYNNYFALIEQFVAEMYDFLNMPRSLIQNLLKIVESLFSNFISDILGLFNNVGLTLDSLKNEIALVYSKIKDAFKDLGSDYKRIEHFENSKFYIKPAVEVVGLIEKEKKIDDKKFLILKEVNISIIPPQKTLKLFLELPGVFNAIYNYQKQLIEENEKSSCKIMRNIVQGTLWNSLIEKYDKNDIILPLVVFFDDLEAGNPLGSHAGINKLGAIYISIATIPPNFSSKLENIFLTLLCYSKHRSTFGNEAIFKKLILDLKYLEESGIEICVENRKFNVKFIVVTFAGDNLGFNSIFGFYESFNATYFCRICLTEKSDSELQAHENDSKIRKKEDYNNHLDKKINVKDRCVWNDLPSFHVYNNWSFDVMHDVMEGIDRYSMALIIKKLLESNFFSLEQLNSRIKYFFYSDLETVPPPINDNQLKNKYIVMSASEMLSLVRNFCFIVGDLVARDNNIWSYYLILLELNEILTSQTFTQQSLEYLQNLISEHHQQFIKLFDEKLKPKFHILLHYTRIIKKIGPPILLSSFKFESKNRDITRICDSITSRKQLPLSVTIRSQLKSCFRHCCKRRFDDVISYSKYIKNVSVPYCSVNWYQINGVKFKKGMAIVNNFDDFNDPVFYEINEIRISKEDDKNVLFTCTLLEISGYDSHFHAYFIDKTSQIQSISIDDCISQALMIRNMNEKYFISISKM